MKKLLLSCMAIAAIAFTTQAQVAPNAEVTYQVNGSVGVDNYEWTVTGGTVLSGGGTNTTNTTVTVRWGAGPTGRIEIIPVSTPGCHGTTTSLNVTIGALDVTLSMGAMANICPLNANEAGGGDPTSVLTFAGTVASGDAIIVTYTADGGSTWPTVSGTLNASLQMTALFADANFTTAGTSTITIRDWSVNSGTPYTPAPASRPTGNVTVNTAPTVTTITPQP
jgi:hypothetical protein